MREFVQQPTSHVRKHTHTHTEMYEELRSPYSQGRTYGRTYDEMYNLRQYCIILLFRIHKRLFPT